MIGPQHAGHNQTSRGQPSGDPEVTRAQHRGNARFDSGAGAHFSFLVHSPNVMKECAPPPLVGMGRDPLQTRRFRWLLEGGHDEGPGMLLATGRAASA